MSCILGPNGRSRSYAGPTSGSSQRQSPGFSSDVGVQRSGQPRVAAQALVDAPAAGGLRAPGRAGRPRGDANRPAPVPRVLVLSWVAEVWKAYAHRAATY